MDLVNLAKTYNLPQEAFGQGLSPYEVETAGRALYMQQMQGGLSEGALAKSFDQKRWNPDPGASVPLQEWSPQFHEAFDMMIKANATNTGLANLIKTTDVLTSGAGSGAPLMRTDLMTHLFPTFVRYFPIAQELQKIDAIGGVQTWVINSSFDGADAVFANELDVATKGQSVVSQVYQSIALGMTMRGSSYREQLAVLASGMRYDGLDPVGIELQNGMRSILALFQKQTIQGTIVAGHTGTDEFGTTNALGFNGLRYLISQNAVSASPTYYPGGMTPNIAEKGVGGSTTAQALNSVVQQMIDQGANLVDGNVEIWCSASAKLALTNEGALQTRYTSGDLGNMTVGGNVTTFTSIADSDIPVRVVPGPYMGYYAAPSGSAFYGGNCEDIYVVQKDMLAFATLGSQMPFVIEIPMGVDGTLGKRYIVAWFASLIPFVPAWLGKVRIAHA